MVQRVPGHPLAPRASPGLPLGYHDWILVVPLVNYVLSSQAFSSDSLYLDPMLYDVFFVSDVEASVIP